MIQNIDAVVVLYHPDESIIENIKTYKEVNTIYAIDNSEKYDNDLIERLKQFDNLIYINNNGNQGIAHALNVGANKAIKNGADWILTMDQDSKFQNDGLKNMIDYIQMKNISNDIGILSPIHLTTGKHHIIKKSVSKVITVMTSGNILNLKAFQEIGEFKEKYFIDYVDHEYCLRLNKNNYKVFVMNYIILYHSLGDTHLHNFFGYNIKCTNHNYLRRYYITRNRLDFILNYISIYPQFCLKDIKSIIIDIIKIILFEENKILKFKYMFCGFRDFINNKFGSFSEN